MALYKSYTVVSDPIMSEQSQELRDLALLASGSWSFSAARVLDGLLLLAFGTFVAIGAAIMRFDQEEIAAESQNSSKHGVAGPSKLVNTQFMEKHCVPAGSSWRSLSQPVSAIVASAAIACIASMALYESYTAVSDPIMSEQSQELRDLALLAPGSWSFSAVRALDGLFVLALGSFAAIGAVIMRIDLEEIAAESQNYSKHVVANPSKLAATQLMEKHFTLTSSSWRSLSQRGIAIVASATIACIASMALYKSYTVVSDPIMSEQSQELRDLAVLASGSESFSAARVLDGLLVLALGIFAAIGAVIMRIDHEEMAELQHPPKPDVASSHQIVAAPLFQNPCASAAVFWQCLPSCAIMIRAFAAIACISSMALVKSYMVVSDPIMPEQSQELRDLALLASSSLVILGVGTFVVIGAFIMRLDHQELASESKNAQELAVPRPSQVAAVPLLEKPRVLGVSSIVA